MTMTMLQSWYSNLGDEEKSLIDADSSQRGIATSLQFFNNLKKKKDEGKRFASFPTVRS
jgi:hypothetical protein